MLSCVSAMTVTSLHCLNTRISVKLKSANPLLYNNGMSRSFHYYAISLMRTKPLCILIHMLHSTLNVRYDSDVKCTY